MERCGACERGVATGVGGTASKRMGRRRQMMEGYLGVVRYRRQKKNVTLAVALDSTLAA
jgi:hypothetical protein